MGRHVGRHIGAAVRSGVRAPRVGMACLLPHAACRKAPCPQTRAPRAAAANGGELEEPQTLARIQRVLARTRVPRLRALGAWRPDSLPRMSIGAFRCACVDTS